MTLVIAGAVLSRTVTVNVRWLELPAASDAVQATVVVPVGKVEPDAGAQDSNGVGSRMSYAVTAYVTIAPEALVAWLVVLAGTVITGAVKSMLIPPTVAVAVFPARSVVTPLTD